jgi:thiamine kinase-like enzyme
MDPLATARILKRLDGKEGMPKAIAQIRQKHQKEVRTFLQKYFSSSAWEFSLPGGSGNETYIARGDDHAYFVKLGAQAARYQAMASIGLTPPLLAAGLLEDGTSIIVQPYVAGRTPARSDYHTHLEQFATAIDQAHHSPEVTRALPKVSSDLFRVAGLKELARIRERWEGCKARVPSVAGFIEESLDRLKRKVDDFQGAGLVASHNDLCNANWLITSGGNLFLIDLESMSLDDPALDLGATLWWYYPPGMRQRFLNIVGHAGDTAFENRMHVRMAMHCLHILLPREGSFDQFEPASFPEWLTDFRAILAGEENPQGYED